MSSTVLSTMTPTSTATSGARRTAGGRPARLLVATLSVVVLTVAVLQTAVVPVLGAIATQLHQTPVSVSWVVTANLLAAAAATPLIGRLADLRNKKKVLLIVLGLALCVIAAAAVHPVLGLAVAGVSLVAVGALTFDRESAT